MGKKNPTLAVLLALIVCLASACTGGTQAQAPAQSPLNVEWTTWQGDYTLLVADKMGFFKEHGLQVVPVRYDSATQSLPDLAGAKLDGGIFTMNDVLLASNLVSLSAVMVSDNGGQYSIVASSGIQTVNDLRGKRIGLALHTSGEMFVSYMLSNAHMASSDVNFVEMAPSQVSQGVPGQADAGLVYEPYTSQALQQGRKVVYQSAYYSSLSPKLLVFRKDLIGQRPNDIRAFLLAWDEAVNYRLSHPKESIAIISKATGLPANELNLTKDITIFTIDDNAGLFSDNPGTDASSIYFIAGFNRDFLINKGYITNPPDLNALLDSSFLK